MVAYGSQSNGTGDHSASTKYSHEQLKSSTNVTISPPEASSTPKKKRNTSGIINGASSPKKRKAETNGMEEAKGDSTPKKKRIVYMDDDDVDRGQSLLANGPNGLAGRINGHGGNNAAKGKDKSALKFAELQEQRRQLPIAKGKEALIREIMRHDTLILLGETGSGKTTQVPQYILESGLNGSGIIAVTQPRRVAATSLATRVAQEQGVTVGGRVGYAVRFQEAYSPSTRIKFVTDGMLARELLTDPLLGRYSVILLDEAHERTLNTDLLMASLKLIQKQRRDRTSISEAKGKGKANAGNEGVGPLKVLIMSATLDAEKFSRFFDNAKVLYVQGRQHPVKIYHTSKSQLDYVDAALRTFFQIHVDNEPGDVLIFLPGQEDIESLEKAVALYASQLPLDKMRVVVCPLYASLQQSQQAKAFLPTPKGSRKCILATNIAETSITISGVRYVIDSGKCKEKRHIAGVSGSGIGVDTLLTQDISKSSAMQRTGRAGREGPGHCFRLFTEDDFEKLPDAAEPEIMRCSLVAATLRLKCLGQDLETLDFLDKPDDNAIHAAVKCLYLWGAIDHQRKLSPIGRAMNLFPLEPSLSRALLASRENGCTREVIGIVSILSASAKVFYDPGSGSASGTGEGGSHDRDRRELADAARAKFAHRSGDHMTKLSVFRAYQELVESGGDEATEERKAGKGERMEWCRRHFLNERALSEAMDIQTQLRRICEGTCRGKSSVDGGRTDLAIDWHSACAEGSGSEGEADRVLRSLLAGLSQNTAFHGPEGGYQQVMRGRAVNGGGKLVVKIHPSSTLSDKKSTAIMYDELVFTSSGSTYARGVSSIPPAFIYELPAFSKRSV